MNKFRKELKYNITNKDFYILQHNLTNLIKKDPNCIDPFTFDSHHAPLYLDRESHINTRSSMQLEGVYNSLRSHSHKKEEASK